MKDCEEDEDHSTYSKRISGELYFALLFAEHCLSAFRERCHDFVV